MLRQEIREGEALIEQLGKFRSKDVVCRQADYDMAKLQRIVDSKQLQLMSLLAGQK